jgi:ligand-binding SRPBCC domain-containing protein
MKHFHHEVRIEAPVEHVWAFFGDTTHWEDWMPRRKTTDISGPLDQVGTTYVTSTKLMGVEQKWTTEIVEVEPPRLVRMHSDYGPMDNTFRFEPDGEATNLVFDSDYEMPGKMPDFLKDLMFTGWMERNLHRMFEDFKALAEARVPAKT